MPDLDQHLPSRLGHIIQSRRERHKYRLPPRCPPPYRPTVRQPSSTIMARASKLRHRPQQSSPHRTGHGRPSPTKPNHNGDSVGRRIALRSTNAKLPSLENRDDSGKEVAYPTLRQPNLKTWQRGIRLRKLAVGKVKNKDNGKKTQDLSVSESKKSIAKVSKLPTVPLPTTSTPPAEGNRAKQQLLLGLERQERQRLVKEYKVTGDPRVFAPFLSPFIASKEYGEWQWDAEVERWWRADKETGERLWEPVDFI